MSKTKEHDIYNDTCLHALVLADCAVEAAFQTNPEKKPLSEEEANKLASRLEENACLLYKTDETFRNKLRACSNENSDATETEAREARDWLKAQMTSWLETIQKEEAVEPRSCYELAAGKNPEETEKRLQTAFHHITSLREIAETQFEEKMEAKVREHPLFPDAPLNALRAVFEPENGKTRLPLVEIHYVPATGRLILHLKSILDEQALLDALPSELQPARKLPEKLEEILPATNPGLNDKDFEPAFSRPFWKIRDSIMDPGKTPGNPIKEK